MSVDVDPRTPSKETGDSALPTRTRRPDPIAHQINVGQDLLSAISASINAAQVDAWTPPVIAPSPGPSVGPRPKTSNAAARLAAVRKVKRTWPGAETRGSMAPLQPVQRNYRIAVNEVFDWDSPIWGPSSVKPVVRDVGPVRSVMEEPLFNLWALRTDEDPLAPPRRTGGSSSETAVLGLAARRASASKDRVHTAYVMLILFGLMGGHQWYLGRTLHGLFYVAVSLSAVLAVTTGQGFGWFVPVVLSLAVDAALLPRYVSRAGGPLFG